MSDEKLRQTMRVRYDALSRQLDHAEPEMAAAESGLAEWKDLKRTIRKDSIPRLKKVSQSIRKTLLPNLSGRLRKMIKRVDRFHGVTWRSGSGWWLRLRIFFYGLMLVLVYGGLAALVLFFIYLGIQLASGISG